MASINVFLSYSHEDEDLRKELSKHLMILQQQKVITVWYDGSIPFGEEWDKHIKEGLRSAQVILLLVSPDFLNSKYIMDVEVKAAMEQRNSKASFVVPVILRPCEWRSSSFGGLKALPKDGTPVTTWNNQDEAFLDIITGIRSMVEHIVGSEIPLEDGNSGALNSDHKRLLLEWLLSSLMPEEFGNMAFNSQLLGQLTWPALTTIPRGVYFAQIVNLLEERGLAHNDLDRQCFFETLKDKVPLLRDRLEFIENIWMTAGKINRVTKPSS